MRAALALALVLTGCLSLVPGADHPAVTIAALWTLDSPSFALTVAGETPAGLSARVTDLTAGRSETRLASEMTERYGQLVMPLGLPLRANHTYRVEVRIGEATVAQRDLQARNGSVDGGAADSARASYSLRMAYRNTTPGNASDRVLAGQGLVDGDRLRFDATGHMNVTTGGMTMRLRVVEMHATKGGGLPEVFRLRAAGTWSASDPGFSGSGTVEELRIESQGRERKAGADGVEHLCDRSLMVMRMAGEVTGSGVTVGLESDARTVTWSRVDTGEDLWVHEVTHQNVTFAGETAGETTERDEAVEPDDAAPDLEAITDWTGLFPHPLAPGDVVEQRGLGDAAIQFVAMAGPPRTVGATTLPTLLVEGHAFRGTSGTFRATLVASGPLAGLPLSVQSAFSRGAETVENRMEITTLR